MSFFLLSCYPTCSLSSTLIRSSIDSNDPLPWVWPQAWYAWSRKTPRCWSLVSMMMALLRSNTARLKGSTKWPSLPTAIWVRPMFITSHHVHYKKTFPQILISAEEGTCFFLFVFMDRPGSVIRYSVEFLSASGACTCVCVFGF